MSEKEEILKSIDGSIETQKLSFYVIRNIIIAVIFSLVLLLPKIYISNHIYLYSIKINKLLNEYYSLKAENSILKSKIEKLKFKNRLNNF
ncbi:hypothetical protein [Caminibacter mediatlanticus]|uniref:Septum formation initiator n=1 Tax=Caminibacter mediatlanticus TB-2 TaxID=391592 RepID=A0AAI9F1Z2_9BACT|nr:hypothetical protein [Caminibacter mediatlanticus]EDM24212.1 hypothetical protein CMTB2_01813 [Caminibacter mediatlanticus TB-2]